MTMRSALVGGLVGVVAATGIAIALGAGEADEPSTRASTAGRGQYVVVIPEGRYQSIVVSPQATGSGGTASLEFTIRARDRAGTVSDFPIFVRAGDVRTITFPDGWASTGESLLLAPANVNFAAWGVGRGTRSNGSDAAGPLVRFEPIYRDTQKDVRDRERARDFEELLREAERNK